MSWRAARAAFEGPAARAGPGPTTTLPSSRAGCLPRRETCRARAPCACSAQTVDVMHARLGATTRQLAHEVTHGVHPTAARSALIGITDELRHVAREAPAVAERLAKLAERVQATAAVGWPPRGHQFVATAQVLLHSPSVARNESSRYEDPLDVPPEERGLQEALVDEIARVRTDLDALEPEVFDLLVAQGYFVADAYLKTGVPDVVRECSGGRNPASREIRPAWAGHTRSLLMPTRIRNTPRLCCGERPDAGNSGAGARPSLCGFDSRAQPLLPSW